MEIADNTDGSGTGSSIKPSGDGAESFLLIDSVYERLQELLLSEPPKVLEVLDVDAFVNEVFGVVCGGES